LVAEADEAVLISRSWYEQEALSTAQEIRSMCRSEIGARRRAGGIVEVTAATGLWPSVRC
jgi:hypothetical protein